METPSPRPNIVFGQRLRAVRKERGWTLRFLAARAGVHWTYLGQVERGERNVSLLTILRLAKALSIDPGVLLKGLKADGGDDTGGDGGVAAGPGGPAGSGASGAAGTAGGLARSRSSALEHDSQGAARSGGAARSDS